MVLMPVQSEPKNLTEVTQADIKWEPRISDVLKNYWCENLIFYMLGALTWHVQFRIFMFYCAMRSV